MTVDYTLHVGDLLWLAGVVGVAARYIVTNARALYVKFEAHEEELSMHVSVLQKMGWRRPENAKFRPQAVNVQTLHGGELRLP